MGHTHGAHVDIGLRGKRIVLGIAEHLCRGFELGVNFKTNGGDVLAHTLNDTLALGTGKHKIEKTQSTDKDE